MPLERGEVTKRGERETTHVDRRELQKRIQPLFRASWALIPEASPDKIVATMLVRRAVHGRRGLPRRRVHGLADTLGAIGTVVNLPPNTRPTTIESKTNFMGGAAVNTRISGESVPLHRGKSTQVWQTTIRSEAGKLCAIVTQTQMVLPV